MNDSLCQSTLAQAKNKRPQYQRNNLKTGIMHLGCGSFHRAHQSVYTDSALARNADDWMIEGVSMRSSAIAKVLNPQDGLYTLIERSEQATKSRIIGAIKIVHTLPELGLDIIPLMLRDEIRIVSLTVTEKAYYLDHKSGGLAINHPDIVTDLHNNQQANGKCPKTVPGLLVTALSACRESGKVPFTLLSCDNLSNNGKVLQRVVCDFAKQLDSELAKWIKENVSFPATMVDRITPAPTSKTLIDAKNLTGLQDASPIETEAFSQWVIEDDFPQGRPDWQGDGLIFTKDIAPFEEMKLRMLNGTHSMLAYSGFIAGRVYVKDVMTDRNHALLVKKYLAEAKQTIPAIKGLDLNNYAEQLCQRFINPAIEHKVEQIAMDGTQKIPLRISAPATEALAKGLSINCFAFATAAWMRYCLGIDENGQDFVVSDPRACEISTALNNSANANEIYTALSQLTGLFPIALTSNPVWEKSVVSKLSLMLKSGMMAAIKQEINKI